MNEMKRKKGNEVIIIGQVSTKEEVSEVRFIAQIFEIEQRFRYLARQQRKK